MGRYIDFDAIWAGMRSDVEGPTATIGGEQVTLPADQPLALSLLLRRLRNPDTRRKVPLDEVVEVLAIVFGQPIVDQWLADGFGRDKLAVLVLSLPGWWAPEAPDAEEPAGV